MVEFELGGKLRKFSFGLECLGNVFERLDVDISTIGHFMLKNPFKATPAILYEAHKSAVEDGEKPVDFTYKDVCNWLDDLEGGINNKDVEEGFRVLMKTIKNQ